MKRAYDEMYLEDGMRNLGTAFDFAKHSYNIEMDDFYLSFVNSGIAEQFENGVPKYISGMSGIEIVLEVLKGGDDFRYKEDYISYDYSCEYWCGWILAYFQWYYSIGFDDLAYYLKMEDLERLYDILHETSEVKATEVISAHIRNKKMITRLQYHRLKNNQSQHSLSEKSGVSLRMIQQYEQRKKAINKASVSSLYSLARVLNCRIENLMEWDFKDNTLA